MPGFNGSGQFLRSYSWATDASNGVPITASRMDTEDNGFATGLSNCLTRDGQSPALANIPMGGYKITGLGNGSGSGDATTIGQLAATAGAGLVGFRQAATGAIARTLATKVAEVVSVRDFGAVGDGATDDAAAIRLAVTAAGVSGWTVYFPAGTYLVASQVDFGRVPFRGAGAVTATITTSLNGSVFKITANATLEGNCYCDLSFVNNIANGATYSSASAIEISGDGTGFFQYNRIERIRFGGFYSPIKITKATHATSFGNECMASWNGFGDLTFYAGNNVGKYGIYFTTGSGTGNTFRNLNGSIGSGDAAAAYLRYEGAYVVGDIVTLGNHVGTAPNFMSIDSDNAVYLSNIGLDANQFDASTVAPLKLGAAAATISGVRLRGGGMGGSTTFATGLGTSFLRGSLLDGLQSSTWLEGNDKTIVATGAQTINLFSVDLDQYNCSAVELVVSGLVGGVGSAIVRAEYLINRDTGVPAVTLARSDAAGAALTLSTAASGTTATFKVGFTSSANSRLDCQIRAVAGSIRVARL